MHEYKPCKDGNFRPAYISEVNKMSFISPEIQSRFEDLPIELKNEILDRNVQINNLNDLIACLEQIVAEG